MVSMNLHQATTALPALIEAALNGEEVVIGDQGIG
jgi:antitoxin (DNA-binding transcriptional repressor) of toxin-antitoxin stability system